MDLAAGKVDASTQRKMSECCVSCGSDSKVEGVAAPVPENNRRAGTTLRVSAMDCPEEVDMLERVLKPLSGVEKVCVNLMGGKIAVTHDDNITPEQLVAAIGKAGLKAKADRTDKREQLVHVDRSHQPVAGDSCGYGSGIGGHRQRTTIAQERAFDLTIFQNIYD